METSAPKAAAGASARIESRVAVLVVGGAFLRVAQGFISLAQFLEFFLGGLVTRIFVGMIFQGQLAIGLLDLLLAGIAVHAQNLVVVAFCHIGQAAGLRATTTLAGRIRRSRKRYPLRN